jgi:hypothetical protein
MYDPCYSMFFRARVLLRLVFFGGEVVMVKCLRAAALVFVAGNLCAAVPPASSQNESAQLTVHEWGTFTSIAGPDGNAVPWRPLSGPSDLPCFVTALNPNSVKLPQGGVLGLKALVRMETPVLYFYAAEPITARVSVGFPEGMFSEWYPQATVAMFQPVNTRHWQWRINWSNVQITPGAKEEFPTDPAESHYYAARQTDAAPLTVGTQQEKFLFYRGIASFAPPIIATVARDGSVSVAEKSGARIDAFVLFERRGGRFGYRVVSADRSDLRIERPELNGTLESLRRDLRDMLIARGLFPREAAAMVDTWHDSWFEEGTRLLYVLPQSTVDGILPIDIDPTPAKITRVFVGRMEVVTPEIETEIAAAMQSQDRAVLRKYGRFLEPIAAMIQPRLAATGGEQAIANAHQLLAPNQTQGPVCRPGAAVHAATPAASIQ